MSHAFTLHPFFQVFADIYNNVGIIPQVNWFHDKGSACPHVGHGRLALFMASISACKLFVENRLFLHLQAVDNDTKAIIV